MTDYETAYRALREGLEALHVVGVNPTDWCADWCAACGRAWPCPTIALLAPSPAEGTSEAGATSPALDYLDRLRTMDPSPSLTRAIDDVEREVRAEAAPVSSGEAGPCDDCEHIHTPEGCTGPRSASDMWAGVSPSVCDCSLPAPVVTPSTEGGE